MSYKSSIDTSDALITDTHKSPIIHTVDSLKILEHHLNELINIEPRFKTAYEQVGVPDLRRNQGGFKELMRAMVGQQLSVAAARSIWHKIESAALTTPEAIKQASDEELRAQGLSKQKIRYVRSLAEHDIDFEALKTLPDSEVVDTLTAVTGIGRWTAEMYLLFSLGRADVLAVDDLALKVGVQDILGLDARPTPVRFRELTEHWSPYRSAASLLLWAHYGWMKGNNKMPL